MHHGRCPPPRQVGRLEALLRSRPGFQAPGRIHFGLWPSHSPSQAWIVGECRREAKEYKDKKGRHLSARAKLESRRQNSRIVDLSLSNEPLGDTTTLSLSLRESREIIRQIKEIRDLKTKQGKALLPICRSSSARGPAPNGMEDVTRTSLLMRKLAIFIPAPR